MIYSITVQAYIQTGQTLNSPFAAPATASFDLKIKNPCINPEYVHIITNDLFYKTYTLGSFADMNPKGMMWDLVPFTYETYPVQHELCGELTYVVTFDGQPVFDSPNSIPMQYYS